MEGRATKKDRSEVERRRNGAALAIGAAFGFLISWGQFSNPDRIREMLLLEDLYLYGMMASAVAVAFVGIHLLRRRGARSLLTREPISWITAAAPLPLRGPPRRRGSALFDRVALSAPGADAPVSDMQDLREALALED